MREIKVLLFHQSTPVSLNEADMEGAESNLFSDVVKKSHDRFRRHVRPTLTPESIAPLNGSETPPSTIKLARWEIPSHVTNFHLSKYTKRHFFGVQESSSPSEKRSFVSTPSRMGRPPAIRDEAIVGV